MSKKNSLLAYFSPKDSPKITSAEKKINFEDSINKENESAQKKLIFSKSQKRRFSDLNDSKTQEPAIEHKSSKIENKNLGNIENYRFNATDSDTQKSECEFSINEETMASLEYPHQKYQFLSNEFRRDKSGNRLNDPDFDPSTLQLPVAFLSSKDITPAMKQWWKIKSANFDTVLFFKMGKFYELFHMDADIGVKELGLTYMKGKYAHAGFPETSFSVHASALVEKGYKVGRVEQTEKPSDVSIRIKDSGKTTAVDKLVKRDLCNIMSSSTRIFDSFDVEVDLSSKNLTATTGFGLLLAITQDQKCGHRLNSSRIGVCILDSSIASFTLADFEDDRSFSKLRTLLAHFSIPVAEIFVLKCGISLSTLSKIKKIVNSAKVEIINKNISAEITVKELLSCGYFSGLENQIPPFFNMGDESYDTRVLSLTSLGVVVHVLKRHLINRQIVSSGKYNIYNPDDFGLNDTLGVQQNMIIDDNALRNLDVVVNSEGYIGRYGTVLSLVNHCITPSGKRLIVNLVCHPLYQSEDINDRLDAVDELLSIDKQQFDKLRQGFSDIPDLERILFRLNSNRQLHESSDHPQNSAILFNEKHFSKKKVEDLILLINGFESAFEIYSALNELNLNSKLLKKLLSEDASEDHFNINNTRQFLKSFKESFDIQKAKNSHVIIPQIGAIPQYDENLAVINEIEDKFNEYLEEIKMQLKCSVKYWGSDRSRYQLEIPASVPANAIPSDFELKSQRKGFKRYSSPYCTDLLSQLVVAETSKQVILKDVYVLLIKKLLGKNNLLNQFIQKIALLDCLLAFAYFSSGSVTNGILCRPIVSESENRFLRAKNSYHPCLSTVKSYVVSNDITVGGVDGTLPTTLLITGPNMGGKSTLMRQTAILIILAQLGCYVPASHFEFTPFDRIFARLGASFDHPNCGESTFYVELSETAVMIKRASSKSLILLDELGRGTATHDGLAIANSILKYISYKIRCITLFSTHYHYIARDLSLVHNGPISMVFMGCLINEEASDSQSNNRITFLYKLKEGICPKSYGFYVARLAGIPEEIVGRGIKLARKMEKIALINELEQAIKCKKEIDYKSLCQKINKLSTK